MAFEFHHRRRIYWQETDMAGIIHFTNYFRYMEETEAEFLHSLGLGHLETRRRYGIMAPRVHAECDFIKTVTYSDELDIHLWVFKKGRSSLGYEFSFKHDGEEVAHGRMIVACVTKDENDKMTSAPIPKALDELLEVAPFAREGGQ